MPLFFNPRFTYIVRLLFEALVEVLVVAKIDYSGNFEVIYTGGCFVEYNYVLDLII